MRKKYVAGLFLFAFSLPLMALETDWIDVKKGTEDKATGTAIREVSKSEKEGSTTVTVAVPKTANTDMGEVVVYSKADEKSKKEAMINVSYEWVADYERDYYGLIIKFGKDPAYPIRLYLKSMETNNINP